MSSTHQGNAARRVLASLVVAATLAATSSAHAVVFGGVTVTGTRWVNGVPTKVRCSAGDGNTLDATAYGIRTFTLVNTASCPIWWDSDNFNHFEFTGKERHVIKAGVPTPMLSFSGVQTAPGPAGFDPAHGAASAYLKCAGGACSSEKGSITYSRIEWNNDSIIFIGTYKAKF